jgi:hypothetical protein
VLDLVSLRADTLTTVVGAVSAAATVPNRLALARIERERDAALSGYRRDRDAARLERTMVRLDVEEADARRERDAVSVPEDIAVQYLRELGSTWRATEGGSGQRMLAQALFERIEVHGFREAKLRLTDTAVAHGLAAVLPARFELGIVDYGRGERI